MIWSDAAIVLSSCGMSTIKYTIMPCPDLGRLPFHHRSTTSPSFDILVTVVIHIALLHMLGCLSYLVLTTVF